MLRTIIYTLLRTLAIASPFHPNLPTSLRPSSASTLEFFPRTTSTFINASYCFEPKTGPLPLNYRDCEVAASEIDPLRLTYPVTFSRRPYAQFKLPKSYRSGTCIIRLDMVHDTDEDRFPLLNVRGAAMELAQACVRPDPSAGPRLGGSVSVGPAKLLHVVMFGKVYADAVTVAKL